MRGAIAVLIATLALIACSQSGPPASKSATPTMSASGPASPIATPATDPASIPKLSGAYGLLFSRGQSGGLLHLVKADATLAASVNMQWNSLSTLCASTTDSVNSLPPVSASNGHVYFREGGKIRVVVPPSSKVDVTSVPDSSSVISFFAASPDDKRIAVVVVDVSSSTTITTRLYVEDLFGGGHHADIYSASAAKSSSPTTLWPMGWHQGNLVLAVVHACVSNGVEVPTEWHVSSATTAARVATIKGSNCVMSTWPSPVGVACATGTGPTTLYDWGGKVLGVTGQGTMSAGVDAVLSPAGQSIFFTSLGNGPGNPTRIIQLGPGPYATVPGHAACGWIDEDHLLATDAVIQFPAETPGNVQVSAAVTSLPQSALPDPSTPASSSCAGRFPGGL
jgi:hypothetical protein